MKNLFIKALLIFSIGFYAHNSFSQEYNTFEVRYQSNLRGDLTFIGNNIVNRDGGTSSTDPNDPYNNLSRNFSSNSEFGGRFNYNDYKDMRYIDVDNDPTTFSSSSATFSFPQANCNLIRYAGLYWSATYPRDESSDPVGTPRQHPIDQIKFRVPGSTYVDITADEILFDGLTNTDLQANAPYACYADVTNLLTALPNASGEYTVANVPSSQGVGIGNSLPGGSAGGWTLIIVYENPNLKGRLISTFDGFARVTGTSSVNIPYSGFETIPAGQVEVSLGVAALEGDYRISGDGLSLEGTALGDPNPNHINPASNFFNSNITLNNAYLPGRNPSSLNTLGYDTDIFQLSNASNSILGNSQTSATFTFSTNGDQYYPFFNSFNVEVIEPIIVLEKRVEDIGGNDITGAGVNLGQLLDYVLSFENLGNDDATNYTIRDVLPINVTLDTDYLNNNLPNGISYVYDPTTRTVTFSVSDNLVLENAPPESIRMRVRVAQNCFDFIDACTDQIENIAFSTYQGVTNTAVISDDPSITQFDACGYIVPGATNFLLDNLENCDFSRTVQLCGDDLILDSGNGFDSYVWYLDNNEDGLIDAGDTVLNDGDPDGDPSTLLVIETGVYIVDKIIADPCKGFQEIITVELFGTTQSNPITALINDTSNTVEGEIVVCPNDGEELPQIFLCGLNDTELVQVNIPDADSIEWERLDESSCGPTAPDCPNRENSCIWNIVETGGDFLASDAGQYRMTINYTNGCFSRFYFNIFKNPLNPQYNSSDIICNTPGNITVTNMPADYEFQLVDVTGGNTLVPYNASPSFDIANNGAYRVEMRQQGVVDGCVFVLDNIGIRNRDFQVNVTARDSDCNGLGEIQISMLNVEAQYYYQISQGGTSVDTFGPSINNDYTFQNLNPGVYDVQATTDDGCLYTEQVEIFDRTDLDVSASLTKNIDCTEGVITVTGSGGFPNPEYSYAIWSYVDAMGTTQISYPSVNDIPAGEYQTTNDFFFANGEEGEYQFIIVDGNLCSHVSNPVTIVVAPSIEYTTTQTDESCFGATNGSFQINVTNSNGYSLSYTLEYPDGSTLSNTSGLFTGLPQGVDYTLTITQTQGAISCDAQEIFTISGPPDSVSGTAVLVQELTCLQNGIVEAQGTTGGVGPYEYSIDGVNFVSGAGAETFTGLIDGTYAITIRDATGCTFVTNPITVDPVNPPTDLTFAATAPNCPAQTSNVTVTVIDGDAPFLFEIISPSPISATSISGVTADFSNLSPNTYTFRVTDDKGCIYTEDFTINPVTPINVTGQLVENITCFNDADGAARFIVSNFNTDFDYSVAGPSSFSGSAEVNPAIDLTGLIDGAYTITVTDNETNCTATANVTINGPPAALTLAISETQPTCTTDGGVLLTASGGWGGNTFEITYPDGTTSFTNNTGSFNNLNQTGTFNVSVTDVNGCIVNDTFVLASAVSPVLQLTPNDFCYDATVGLTLTATISSGGDGNYQYNINGGSFDNNNIFTGLGPGTYTVEVRDGNNCTDSETITINPELTVSATASNIIACGTDALIDINAAGGDGNYVYAVVGDGVSPTPGNFSTTNPIAVTGAGDYDVYVRDASGGTGYCEAIFDINVLQDSPVSISVANTPILCGGEASSTITITASGGEAPYQYSIDDGTNYQPSNTFVNRGAGSYNIRVRDVNNCDVAEIYTITEPLTLSASAGVSRLAQCNPGLGAEVRITNVIGGTSPYEYSFDGGVSYGNNSIGFLMSGTHSVFVRDSNLCSYQMSVTVNPEPSPPNVTTAVSYEDCDGDGTITVTTDSTSFDYTYELNGTANTPDTSNIFTDVPPGDHTITVNYITNVPVPPSILLEETFGSGTNTAITEIDPVYCYEPQDGSTSSCPAFGTNPFIQDGEYSVTQSIDNLYTGWVNPNDHTGNANGRYLAINVGGVAGVNGIIYAKRNIEVIANRDVTISLWAFNIIENNPSYSGLGDPSVEIQLVDSSGSIIASTTTSNIPKNNNANDWHNYSVVLNPGANNNLDIVIRTNSAVINGNDIAIDDITALQQPENCPGSISVPVSIEAGREFMAAITSSENADCNGVSNASISFEVENFGASGFQYQINGGGFSPAQTTPTTVVLNGLSAGTYTIEVRDDSDNSCSVVLNQTLSEPPPLAVSNLLTQPTCTTDGSVIISVSGGTGGYTYEIEQPDSTVLGPQTSDTFNNLAQYGLHTITVIDAAGCTVTDSFTTIMPSNPTASIDATSDLCYNAATGATIVVNASGGVSPYFYSINGGPQLSSNSFSGLVPGNYTFTVTDSFGCTDDVVMDIEPEVTANLVLTKDIDCTASPDAVLTLSVNGGYTTYTYEINSNGGGYTSYTGGLPYTTMTPGTYQFRVTDNQGCTAETNIVTVTAPVNPQATVVVTDPACNGDSNGIIEINVNTNFGIAPYEYSFNGSPFTSQTVYPGLAAGTYSYTVRDAGACTFTDTVTLTNPAVFTANVTPFDVTCGGSGDVPGRIEIDIPVGSGGAPNFTYTLYDNLNNIVPTTGPNPIVNTPNTNITFDGLSFGDYYVRIIDANGCEFYQNPVRILASPYLSVNSSITVDCATGGTVELISSGGSGDYNFTIYGLGTGPTSEVTGPGVNEETATFTGLNTGQDYIFQVIDNITGCSSFVEETIPALSAITVVPDPTVNDVTCNGDTDGSITFQIQDYDGTVTDINYEIRESLTNTPLGGAYSGTVAGPSGPGPTPSLTINNIPAGDYVLYFEEATSPFCSNTYEFRILEPNPVTLGLIAQNTGNCGEDANVTVLASGGDGTFIYAFVEDGVVPIASDYSPSNYAELDPSTNTDWDVHVLDGNGCLGPILDITIADDPEPVISGVVTNQCSAPEGSFNIEITLDVVGIGPYDISINGGAFQSTTLTNVGDTYQYSGLSSGSYTFALRDVNTCGNSVVLDVLPPPSITATVTVQPSCLGGDGEIVITPYGGSGAYLYELFDSSSNSVSGGPQAVPIFTGLNVDSYTAYVYDQILTGCDASVMIATEVPQAVIFTTSSTDVMCFGDTDGTIAANLDASMNNPPYTYQLFDNTGLIPQTGIQTSNIFTGLAANSYVVRVYSGRACQFDVIETVGGPTAISNVNASVVGFGCTSGNNPNNATITIDNTAITGGSGTYVLYEFINDQGTATVADDVVEQSGNNNIYIETDNAGGTYIINVYDDNGCVGSTTATIQPFDGLLSAAAAITNPLSCSPGTDGEITITVASTNNDPTRFEYSIDNGVTWQNTGTHTNPEIFTNLDAGTYNFRVRHIDTGCVISTSETIISPNTFTIDVNVINDAVCFGTQTGQVTFELVDATYSGPIEWEIFDTNGTPTNTADDISVDSDTFANNGPTLPISLLAGSYYVEVTQANFPQCANTEAFTIAGPSADISGATQITAITCAGNDGAIEIINVAGGWGGYRYYASTTPNPDPNDVSNYSISPLFDNLVSGTYEIWIIDQNGCAEQLTSETLADPTPIIADLQINNYNCVNLQGQIEVVGVPSMNPITGGQGSNYTYQLIRNGSNIGSPQNTTLFSGLGAGSYEVYIIDQWGCDTTVGPVVLNDVMTATAEVIKSIDCTVDPGGHITINVNGGSSNLEYQVTYPISGSIVTQNNGVFTGLTEAGEYIFNITDLDTATPCTLEIRQSLDAPATISFDTPTIVDVSCFGGSDGSVTINLTPQAPGINDNPTYTYNLYDGGGAPLAGPQNSPTFTDLAFGTYQIEAVSGRGCQDIMNVSIGQPDALTVTASATPFACSPSNAVTASTLTITAFDGTAPYLYSIDNANFQTSNSFDIVDTGVNQTIQVFVEDANGCTATNTVSIATINVFTVAISQTAAINCANPEEILLTVTDNGNGANTYTYELLPIGNPDGTLTGTPTAVTAVFELTTPGSYTFRVTDNDTGCYVDTTSYTISPFDTVDVTATATAAVSCFGDSSGALQINVTGYSGAYDYEVFTQAGASVVTGSGNTSSNPHDIPNITGGNYFVRLTQTENPFCVEDSNMIQVLSPDSILDATPTEVANVTCTNDQGEIEISPQGGYVPYDIVLTNTTTSQSYSMSDVVSHIFTGLSAGDYTIQITDDNDCTINRNLTLTPPIPISADISAAPALLDCYGDNDATVSAINVINGQGVYLYQLNTYDATGTNIMVTSGPQTSPDFDGLGAGIYSITVSDGWSCGLETTQVTISEPEEVRASLIQVNPLTCNSQAQLELTATGGTAPYQYSTDNSNWNPMTGGNSHTFSVGAGVYQYYVIDANGCEANISNQISVDAIPPLTIAIDDSAAIINCAGESSAIIIANVTGGLGDYSYELFDDAALTNSIAGPQTNNSFSGLSAGNYFIRVISQDCIAVEAVSPIAEPVPLQVDSQEFTDISCAGEEDGTITVNVSGGTGQILYAISPNLNRFDVENTFTDLASGIYDVIAQDERGCFIPFQFTISAPNPIDVTAVNVLNEICAGSEDGSIEITIAGGTAPYRTSLNSNEDADFVSGQLQFSDLAAGTHVIFVRDANNCGENIIVEIEPGVNLNATVTPVYDCVGNNTDNYIQVDLEDGIVADEVLYALNSTNPADMQLTPDFTNVPPGDHYLTIAHSNGCVNTVDFSITNFEPLSLFLEQNNINEITAIAEGGLENYTFYFDGQNNGSENTYFVNRTDTFTVTVIDENGCEVSAEIFIEFIDIEIPTFFTPNGDGTSDTFIPENLEAFPDTLIIIFDRYGRELYRMRYGDTGWDGTYQGTGLPTGDYWYVIKLKGENDDREFVGHFTLYR
jgi:gliding motility-associated-like protein